jgi:chromosome segregation ATPase
LSVEEQIEKILNEEAKALEKANEETSEILSNETKRTEEYKNRKRYHKPVIEYDAFDKMTANALGVREGDIEKYSSVIVSLTSRMGQLKDAYSRLSAAERDSPFGRKLRDEFQTLSREVGNIRKEFSRPISLSSAMVGPEKTLDDIAYKIKRLQSYMQGLDTSNEKSAEEFKRAALNVKLLQEKESELLEKNSRLINSIPS